MNEWTLETVARALEIIEDESMKRQRPLYTRETLGLMVALVGWGDGHKLIKFLETVGLISRVEQQCVHDSRRHCKYVVVTEKGRRYLYYVEMARQLLRKK